MNPYRALIAAAALALGACASDPALVKDQAAFNKVKISGGTADIARQEGKVDLLADDRVHCERFTPTGSHRTQVRCLTKAEKVTNKEANARELRKMTVPPPNAPETIARK